MNYKVIPNFLPLDLYNFYYDYFFTKSLMNWQYMPNVGTHTDDSSFFFTKDLININPLEKSIGYIAPNFLKISTPLIFYGNIYDLIRVKVNCFIKQPTNIKTAPHIDHHFPHNVLLYSINDNNGYTILDPNGENIKIPSVANQALVFDGLIQHQAVTQTDENVRINININYHVQ